MRFDWEKEEREERRRKKEEVQSSNTFRSLARWIINNKTMPSSLDASSQRVLAPSYLSEASSKPSHLLRRLHKLIHVLQHDESLEPDHLASTSTALVALLLEERHGSHKEIRLAMVTAVLEVLAIYAPECPLDETETLAIFRHVITQLANIATLTDAAHDSFSLYQRILVLLAQVRMGVILVEVAKNATLEDNNNNSSNNNQQQQMQEQPNELLAEFVHALLHCLRAEHPSEILELAHGAVLAVIEEYDSVPIFILDELLLCIGQGPFSMVMETTANAAAAGKSNNKSKKKTAPKQTPGVLQKKVPNPSFNCAAKVLHSAIHRLSTPVAALLNGLLYANSHIMEQSSISVEPSQDSDSDNVYTIIRYLGTIATGSAGLLTTVLGTLSSHGLESIQEDTRLATTKLLGHLFAQQNNSNLSKEFRKVFQQWLGRRKDVCVEIRMCIIQACVQSLSLMAATTTATSVSSSTAAGSSTTSSSPMEEISATLTQMIQDDPDLAVRMKAIFAVCDWVYRLPTKSQVAPTLLKAVASRVSSKHKEERKSAMTGLAQLYFRQYLREKVKTLQHEQDQTDIGDVLQVLNDTCRLRVGSSKRKGWRSHRDEEDGEDEDDMEMEEATYGWIPSKVFECAYFTDAIDSEMRSRVIQVVDEVLLGSSSSSSSDKQLSVTARAVGLTMILNAVSNGDLLANSHNEASQTNAYKYMRQLFAQKALLQKVLLMYLEARVELRNLDKGSEEYFAVEARTMDLLHKVVALAPPASANDQSKVAEAIHGARDKHIFRLLSTVVEPKQTSKARARALDELPKRTKSLGEATTLWIKNLVRRCSMGDFINVNIAAECARLAHECFGEQDIGACAALLASVKTIIDVFPSLGGLPETFANLTELFSECRAVTDKHIKKDVTQAGILTTLSSILAKVTPIRPSDEAGSDDEDDVEGKENLQKELLQVCTRDGTPEQARHAMFTLARMMVSNKSGLSQSEELTQVLQTLTSSSKLVLSKSDKSIRVVRMFSALSALAECAPGVLLEGERGQKALKFALETALMGRNRSEDSDDEMSEDETKTPGSSRKRSSHGSAQKHVTPENAGSLLEDESLSIACRTLCAAIDFLVTSIRSAILSSLSDKSVATRGKVAPFVGEVFKQLVLILRDQGLPQSDCDRRSCRARQDRAALRQCAAVHLFRLCDSRLGLESQYLDPTGWHCLASILLDEECSVRESCLEELSHMITGKGEYASAGFRSSPPALRFVALIVLCTEGDSTAACGNASKIGKASATVKMAATASVGNLRKVCEAKLTQYKAKGYESEFETAKIEFMPEYMVPYAIHLLTHRRETPFTGGVANTGNETDGDVPTDDESQYKVLRKRLKMLFEPLILSLGENADNISFLLRMTDMLSKYFQPVDVAPGFGVQSNDRSSVSSESAESVKELSKRSSILEAKLKTVSSVAREVLLTFVKKDANLNHYPGSVLFPSFLFKKMRGKARREVPTSSRNELIPIVVEQSVARGSHSPFLDVSSQSSSARSQSKRSVSPGTRESLRKSPRVSRDGPSKKDAPDSASPKASRVHFSPDVRFQTSSTKHEAMPSGESENDLFGDMSPIAQSMSPSVSPTSPTRRSPRLSNSAPTLGTTPPSDLRGATLHSTAPYSSSRKSSVDGSPVVQSEIRRSKSVTKISSDSGASADDEGDDLVYSADTLDTELENDKSNAASKKPTKLSSVRTSTRPKRGHTIQSYLQKDDVSEEDDLEPPKPASQHQPSKKGVPMQIKINRVDMPPSSMESDQPGIKAMAIKRGGKGRARKENLELDFDDDDDDENTNNRRGSKGGKRKAATKTTSALSSRAVKVRR